VADQATLKSAFLILFYFLVHGVLPAKRAVFFHFQALLFLLILGRRIIPVVARRT
jgi:hypothetical protein